MLLKRCSRNRSRKNIILACLIAFIVVTSPAVVLGAGESNFYTAGLYLNWSNTYHSWVIYNGMMAMTYIILGYDPTYFVYYGYQFAGTSYNLANTAYTQAATGYAATGSISDSRAYYAQLYAQYHRDYKLNSYNAISYIYSSPSTDFTDPAYASAIIDGYMANYYCGVAQYYCGLLNGM